MVNRLKPFTHASLRIGEPLRGSSKWLFLFPLRQPFDSRYVTEPAWADKSGNTAPITPVGKMRPALVWRLVKNMVHRWYHKAIFISEQTRQAHLGLFVISTSIGVNMNTMKSGAGRIEIGSIHPWRNYARKDNNV